MSIETIEEFLDYYVQPYYHVGAKERLQTLRQEWEREAVEGFLKSKIGKVPNGSSEWENGFSDGCDFMVNKIKEFFGIDSIKEPQETCLQQEKDKE